MPPAKAKQHPRGRGPPRGRRLDPGGPQARGEAERGRPRPGPAPPAEQRRVRPHRPRPDRRRHPADPEFPVDPANEAGFDNSAESLTMSPALVKKYLEAARLVADHLVLKPRRVRLRPAPGRRRHRPRQVLRPADHRLLQAAADRLRRLLPRRLAVPAPRGPRQARGDAGRRRRRGRDQPRVPRDGLGVLTGPPEEVGPDRRAPGALAGAAAADGERGRRGRPGRLRADARLRRRAPPAAHAGGQEPDGPRDQNGSQPLVLWKNRQFVANRRRYAGGAARIDRPRLTPGPAAARALAVPDRPGRRSSGTRRPSPGSARPSPTPSSSRSGPASTSTRRRRRRTRAGC